MKKYFVVKVNFENGDSRNIATFSEKFLADRWADINRPFYNNSLSVEPVEDNRPVVRFSQNGPRHHGKYQTRAFIFESIESMKTENSIPIQEMKTCRFNTEEGVDQEAQRSYLLKKIQKQFGKDIFCIY